MVNYNSPLHRTGFSHLPQDVKPSNYSLVKRVSLIFGSKTKAQEIIFILHDAKAVVRQGFYDSELAAVERSCEEYGLYVVKSKFKVLIADDGQYSNKGWRVSEDDKRQGMYFAYISKREDLALLASYYELMGNDTELGKILGYPECCVAFFMKHFSAVNPNPEHVSSNMFTNLSQREKDSVLISHFPCSVSLCLCG